jgi:hypothetical protein
MSLNYKKNSEFSEVGVGVEKKFFSESESGFGIKKCDSADHYSTIKARGRMCNRDKERARSPFVFRVNKMQ